MTERPAVKSNLPKTARERGRIAPIKFAHIVFRTSRYDAMVQWYRVVLEAEAMMESPLATFLTYDDEHHRVAILQMPGLSDQKPGVAGTDHCAFTYASLEELFATYERLRDQGIEPYWTINHGPTLSMYYRDPDDNQVELQIDVFATVEETNAWLAESDFADNPIGVKFDAEDLLRRHRSGESRASLLARPTIDPGKLFEQLPSG